jgi:homoserine dehydrogenase
MKIGIFGGGTVGGGVVEILAQKEAYVKALTNTDISIAKLCVRDPSKSRDFALPPGCTIVTDYNDILQDDTIDTIVEVMGGTQQAKDVVLTALQAGKHVVTANKALIAKCLPEIQATLDRINAQRQGQNQPPVQFRFESFGVYKQTLLVMIFPCCPASSMGVPITC